MRFFRKIQISNPKHWEKCANESLSNGTIRPLELGNVKLKSSDKKKEEIGNTNEGFDMIQVMSKKENHEIGGISVVRSEGNSEKYSKQVVQREVSNHKRRRSNWETLKGGVNHFLDQPKVIHWVTLILLALVTWCVLQCLAGSKFLPGSQLFSLLALFILAYLAGALTELIRLPSLLGMLLMGLLLRNIGFIHLRGVYTHITAALREIALSIILIRAGLGLDPTALRSLKFSILKLAAIPGIVEGIISTILTHYLMDFPWLWGILLGSVLAAVSPAVVIPCLFSLQERGYGTGKGIPTLIVAAASLDDILAITVFGVVLDLIYTSGKSLTLQVVQGPLGVFMGITFGIVWGFIAHFAPHQRDNYVVLLRVLLVLGGGLMSVIGSRVVGFQGAGPLGCITAAFIACLGWRKQAYNNKNNPVADVFQVMWTIFQPILFGLIGSEIDVSVLEMSTVGNGLLTLFCSLLARIAVTILIAFGAELNWKEKIFVAWAWFPKATVQAALGPFTLDVARRNGTEEDIVYAKKLLILAVLAILITAPTGAVLITILGPRLLAKESEKPPQEEPQPFKTDEAEVEETEEEKN